MDLLQTSAEEISTDEKKVRPSNFAFNSDQFFFELFTSEEDPDPEAELTLTVLFDDTDGEQKHVDLSYTVSELLQQGESQIKSAAMATRLAQLVKGDLDCEAVLNSDLYRQESEADIFVEYQNAIKRFCGYGVRPPSSSTTSTSSSSSSGSVASSSSSSSSSSSASSGSSASSSSSSGLLKPVL